MPKPDQERGLYRKWHAVRTDGSSAPGGKHADCAVFVLDLKHDKFARAALLAYQAMCEEEFPALALDIQTILKSVFPARAAQGLMDKEP